MTVAGNYCFHLNLVIIEEIGGSSQNGLNAMLGLDE